MRAASFMITPGGMMSDDTAGDALSRGRMVSLEQLAVFEDAIELLRFIHDKIGIAGVGLATKQRIAQLLERADALNEVHDERCDLERPALATVVESLLGRDEEAIASMSNYPLAKCEGATPYVPAPESPPDSALQRT